MIDMSEFRKAQEKYPEALNNDQTIQLVYPPPLHSCLAATYNKIGSVSHSYRLKIEEICYLNEVREELSNYL
jgi:hypothetical protein